MVHFGFGIFIAAFIKWWGLKCTVYIPISENASKFAVFLYFIFVQTHTWSIESVLIFPYFQSHVWKELSVYLYISQLCFFLTGLETHYKHSFKIHSGNLSIRMHNLQSRTYYREWRKTCISWNALQHLHGRTHFFDIL